VKTRLLSWVDAVSSSCLDGRDICIGGRHKAGLTRKIEICLETAFQKKLVRGAVGHGAHVSHHRASSGASLAASSLGAPFNGLVARLEGCVFADVDGSA
jgi:hypothetical protein